MKRTWTPLEAGALIVLLTIAAYLPALRGGFVFDDYGLIAQNRMVRARDGLYRFWFTAETPDYRPLTWSLWWLEWRLWDGSAPGYHAVNVALHAVNAVLVWMILQRLKIPSAWLAAAVFAIHPVNVATVAWISEQKNTLSMLFYALSILLYLRFDEEDRWAWYGWSLAAFLLALLAKTAVVMLPFVLLGCMWWRHGRVRWKDLLRAVPFFLPSLAMGIVTIAQHRRVLGRTVVQAGGAGARLATAGCVPWFYLSKALLPVNLTMIYPRWHIDPTRWVSYVPGTVLIGCLVVFWCQRKTWGRGLLFGLGYFVVTLFPVLGFFDQYFFHYSFVADHWQYYSIVGVIALVVAAIERIDRKLRERNRRVPVPVPFGTELVGVTALIVLGAATWSRCCIYADSERLWWDNLAKNPGAWVAQSWLGTASEQAGKLQEAIGHYGEALRIKPDYAGAHYNLGRVLVRLGRLPEAIEHYEQALKIDPDFVDAHNNLGAVLWQTDRVPEAIEQFEQALKIDPDSVEAHYSFGLAMAHLGKLPEAMEHLERAIRLRPDYAEAHYNLGMVLTRSGNVPEAIKQYEKALQIEPDYAEAHYNLGVLLAELGRMPEAIAHWEQVLRIKPDYAAAHYSLGVALEQMGRVQEAIGHYEQAVRLKPDFAEAQKALVRLRVAQ